MSLNETSRGLRCIFKQSPNFLALGICLGSFTGVLCAADAPDVKPPPSPQTTSADPKSEEARKILEKAYETMSNLKTFKAEILDADETNKTKSKTIIYKRNNSDGFLETRREYSYSVGDSNHARISITNRAGFWELTPTTAIKMEYEDSLFEKAQQGMVGIKKAGLESPNYSFSEMVINEKPYWVVKETSSKGTIKKVLEVIGSSLQLKEMFKNGPPNIPFVTLYRISKENGIIISTQEFDQKGNKIHDTTYDKIEVNLPLSDDLFSIPVNLKIKAAKTIKDYIALKTGKIEKE